VDHELEQDFASKRTRKKKWLPCELSNDEIEKDPVSRYRRETFVYAIGTAIMSIRDRFSSHKAILADFSLLDPERFQDINSSKSLAKCTLHIITALMIENWRKVYLVRIDLYQRSGNRKPIVAVMMQ
jgi:hypothetical protein